MAERLTTNQEVAGSTPAKIILLLLYAVVGWWKLRHDSYLVGLGLWTGETFFAASVG